MAEDTADERALALQEVLTMIKKSGREVLLLILIFVSPAHASFHLMQIEQVIGGVQGDTTAQAIQLRMRAAFQHEVSRARLVAWDANGANPVVIISFGSDVARAAAGDRILVTSASFTNSQMQPPVASDFTMSNVIPASYLAAGRLTFENSSGNTFYWSLCWGGAGYTGPTVGALTNDDDADFGPCFGGPLPSTTDQAVQFTGAAAALSTTNAADYALTPGMATFVNNARASGAVPVELQSFSVND